MENNIHLTKLGEKLALPGTGHALSEVLLDLASGKLTSPLNLWGILRERVFPMGEGDDDIDENDLDNLALSTQDRIIQAGIVTPVETPVGHVAITTGASSLIESLLPRPNSNSLPE